MEKYEVKCPRCEEWEEVSSLKEALLWSHKHGFQHTPVYRLYAWLRNQV